MNGSRVLAMMTGRQAGFSAFRILCVAQVFIDYRFIVAMEMTPCSVNQPRVSASQERVFGVGCPNVALLLVLSGPM